MKSVVNWEAILDELHRLGFSTYRIAAQTHIPRSTLDYFRVRRNPRHDDGERLLQFWMLKTGKPREQAPMEAPLPPVHSQRRHHGA